MWICRACMLVFSVELSQCPRCGEVMLKEQRTSEEEPAPGIDYPDERSPRR
jgi:rRNA maturation endonuclease Nob1